MYLYSIYMLVVVTDHEVKFLSVYRYGHTAVTTFLLQEAQCNPNYVTHGGPTPLDLTNEPELIHLLLSSGAKPVRFFPSHLRERPTDMAIMMFVLGNSGAGKSTFVKSLSTEGHIFSRIKHQFTKVRDVDEKTAGIIPHDIHSKALGRLILYDLAGHKEYYAGHDALLHNTMTNSPSIVILVVDMRDEEGKIRETLQYWFQFINNHSSEGGAKPHLLIIGSHADVISSSEVRQKSRVLESVVHSYKFDCMTFAGQIIIDCRYAESSSMTKLRSMLSQICQTLRSSKKMAAAHHSFLIFLLHRFGERLAVTFTDAVTELRLNLNSREYVYLECMKSSDPLDIIKMLTERGNILFMKNKEHPENSWIVLDKAVLLSKVNGVIFAPEGFKEHQKSLSTSTGVVPLSKLAPLLPNLHSDVITQFLCHLEFCHEITDSEILSFLLASTCLTETQAERFFFFPGLVDRDVPSNVWQPNDQFSYHSGWLLQCSMPDQFLSPRFLQVLLLRLVYGLVLTSSTNTLPLDDHPSLERNFSVWKNGICWSDRLGVETVVEVRDQRSVIVMMRSLKLTTSEMELISTRSHIIDQVVKTKKELCSTVAVYESVIRPEDATSYPLNVAEVKTVSISEISHAVINAHVGVLDSSQQMVELENRLLCFEPYAGLGKDVLEQLFNEDNQQYHSEVDDEFLYCIADHIHGKTDSFVALFQQSATRLDNIVDQAPRGETHRLVRMFQLWREEMGAEGTYSNLRKKLDQFSIFAGRSPISLCPVYGQI